MNRKNESTAVDLILIERVTAFGGTERHTVGLIEELQRRGLRVAFIESGEPHVSSRIENRRACLTIVRTRLSTVPENMQEILAWKRMLQKFETRRVLIVKSSYGTGSFRFLGLLKLMFAHVVSIEHTTVPSRVKWSPKIHFERRLRTGVWWYRDYLNLKKRAMLVDHVITVSEFNKTCLSKNALVPGKKITVCVNGIDVSVWRRESFRGDKFRERFDIPGDALLFGCVGRLEAEKGFELAIDAFKKFQKCRERSNAYLIIIGEGRMRDEWRRRAERSEGRIIFTGFVEDLVPAYSAIDVALFTSHHEGVWSGESFGLTLVEAMACECGVIAMNKGATTEIIGDLTDACELLEARDVWGWAEAMRKYSYTPKEILAGHGSVLRRRVMERYDAKSTYSKLVDAVLREGD